MMLYNGMMSRFGEARFRLVFAIALLSLLLVGCGPSAADLEAVDYTPESGGDWPVSTPEEQGFDPDLVAALYADAAQVETLRALLVIGNGQLIAEDYFGDGAADQKTRIQSVTKSFTSALTGIAIEQGCLTGVDQKMIDFFPEEAERIRDPRKNEISVQHMLQMRGGYPWEESNAELFEMLYSGFYPSYLVDVPLVRDPGTGMEYSNLTSHLLGVVTARACDTRLVDMAGEHLFQPLGIVAGDWIADWEGNNNGHADLYLTARDMAKFGLLYLNEGEWDGQQIVPRAWVHESLTVYSEDAWPYRVGRNFKDIGYGYQWWSVQAGDHHYWLAWGHGGQQIAVVDDLDLVVVVKADPLFGQHGDEPWRHEKANLNLVADFIASLPVE